ncbi:MAG: threonine ammonia-lyase, biosynthetic [Pseudomonadota bacterium]
MYEEYKKLIDEACQRIYSVAKRTDLDLAPQLSERHQNNIWLKREDQQPVFSYKLRGAYNMIASLSETERECGVITASAGNHAQGVAMAAQEMNINAIIVMPKTTPEIKVSSVKRMNAEVILHGNTYDEAKDFAHVKSEKTGMCYVPPFDHPLVIAGQATVAVELMDQHPVKPEIIFVPVGGGGLISGIAAYLKDSYPDIKIIGVEHDEAPSMYAAFEADERVILDQIGIFADGAAVIQVGEENYRIAKESVDEVLLVNIDEICASVKDIFEDTRSIPEPAGALALAGLKQYIAREKICNKELIAIFSGANVNFDRLRHIAELSALGENREGLLVIGIPERPGSFRHLCHDLGPRLITEFNYRYGDNDDAFVFVGVQLKKGVAEKDALIKQLIEKGYDVTDLSNDTIAKMHIRYMVGGHAPQAENEVIYRFEFPERSGALLHFLTEMGERWNISLFHYRNHGAAYGRVLIGFQVKEEDREQFQKFVDGLGITYWKETDNPAYQKFLS